MPTPFIRFHVIYICNWKWRILPLIQTCKRRSLEIAIKLKYLPKKIGPLACQTTHHYFCFLFCQPQNGRWMCQNIDISWVSLLPVCKFWFILPDNFCPSSRQFSMNAEFSFEWSIVIQWSYSVFTEESGWPKRK